MFKKFLIMVGYSIPVSGMVILCGMLIADRVMSKEAQQWALCFSGIEIDNDECLSARAQKLLENERALQKRQQAQAGRVAKLETALSRQTLHAEQAAKASQAKIKALQAALKASETVAKIAKTEAAKHEAAQGDEPTPKAVPVKGGVTFKAKVFDLKGSQIVVGMEWGNGPHKRPTSQWCYALLKQPDRAEIRLHLAYDLNKQPRRRYFPARELNLSKYGITEGTFKEMQRNCDWFSYKDKL